MPRRATLRRRSSRPVPLSAKLAGAAERLLEASLLARRAGRSVLADLLDAQADELLELALDEIRDTAYDLMNPGVREAFTVIPDRACQAR